MNKLIKNKNVKINKPEKIIKLIQEYLDANYDFSEELVSDEIEILNKEKGK